MTDKPVGRRPVVARVACHCGATLATNAGYRRDFAINERVCSVTQVKNDGTYPHKDIGEVVVHDGDAGYVRESWSFLGRLYYTVEFCDRNVVVIMRGQELASDTKPISA